jgi:dTDP-4-amino-4,6-dideoxygalactose transaminase
MRSEETVTTIPFVDLKAQYQSIKTEMDAAIERIVSNTAFIGGSDMKAFEEEFAAYCADGSGMQAYSASCGNGTDAIYLALKALGIGEGDEVITVSHTFIATAEMITMAGAKPVFIDIVEDTMLMDPELIEAAITARTKAIIPVHLYGQLCDMDRIMEIANRHGLKVVEDAAQSHGARWNGKRAGMFGHAATFSFYPGKNLGAYGDAGAVVSTDEQVIHRIRMMANHGRTDKYLHEFEGTSSRLDGMQAAVLRVKLPHLDSWNEGRRQVADRYCELLSDGSVTLPTVHPNAEPVWHLFVIRTTDREGLQAHLKDRSVSSGVHYPVPLHLQPAYAHLGMATGSLPVTERVAEQILSLPMYSELTDDQIHQVVDAVRSGVRVPA